MLISLNWINELLKIEDIKLEELVEKLTLGGFEVEETFELLIGRKKETILEISATANRADSISAKGIAKEIGALTDQELFHNSYGLGKFEPEIKLQECFTNFQILDNHDCSTFILITAENIDTLISPKWMQQKLLSAGIEPQNNLSDFQNFLILETGFPFEFYDLDKIKAKLNKLNLKFALAKVDNETLLSSVNNETYALKNNILVLKEDNTILSVAGLIANGNFCCDQITKSILIEGSIFSSKKIRQMSRSLGVRTERSARYEKGLNNSKYNESICRLLNLLRINNTNIKYEINSIGQTANKLSQSIFLNYKNVLEILGPTKNDLNDQLSDITPKQISTYLERLNFVFEFEAQTNSWNVVIPNSRKEDISREIDLIEEIARLHGFNNFVSYLPIIKEIGIEDFGYQSRKKLITCFLSEGLNELIQYSLVKKQINQQDPIKLVNPLISDCSTLRRSLLPSITETISENLKQGNRNIEGFEFGHVFFTNTKNEFYEKEYVSGNFGNIETKITWSDSPASLSWFEAKGKLEEIFKKLNIALYWTNSITELYEEILHPYRTAEFYLLNGNPLGIFGQIHPILAKQLNISNEVYLFEFNFECLKNELKNNLLPLSKNYSTYPKIIKDLSFIVSLDVSFEEIKTLILRNGTNVLTHVNLLDKYQGNSIPSNYTSLCIQLVFQSTSRTLQNEEIENIINSLKSTLIKQYQIIQRV